MDSRIKKAAENLTSEQAETLEKEIELLKKQEGSEVYKREGYKRRLEVLTEYYKQKSK